MAVDFKDFAPHKDDTVTVTRKLTVAERKAKQLKTFTSYVVNELFRLHDNWGLDRVDITRFKTIHQFTFTANLVSVVDTSLQSGFAAQGQLINSEALKNVLIQRFDICDIARLLKLAYKRVNDKLALKGNKPQAKVIKKSELEEFVVELNKLKAKYPDIAIYGDCNGDAYAEDMSTFKTSRIYLS